MSERRQSAKRSIDRSASGGSERRQVPGIGEIDRLPVGLRSDSEVGADGVNQTKAGQSMA
jgi:hypothetical protein